ncbi:MAG TPA: hypothetical protein VNL13_02825 [Sulfolobales archaeon]|nr:hypothetical protein [Sulfolobales archaeon]
MAELVIGLPRIERAVDMLSESIEPLLKSYGSLALPLPKSLCTDLVVEGIGGSEQSIEALSLKYYNPSLVRIWWSVIKKIPRLALEHPDSEIICYDEDTRPEKLEKASYRLASLLIRARLKIYERIDPRPWIEFFKPTSTGSIEIPETPVVIADGYVRFKEILGTASWKKAEKIWKLIPTPLELLEMIAKGYLEEKHAEEAVRFSVRYLGDYVIGSRDLTEAYEKLLNDKEYLDLLRRIDPNIARDLNPKIGRARTV